MAPWSEQPSTYLTAACLEEHASSTPSETHTLVLCTEEEETASSAGATSCGTCAIFAGSIVLLLAGLALFALMAVCYLRGGQPPVATGQPLDGGQPLDDHPNNSLFCFVLMMSDTYELLLLRKQFQQRFGVFSCDGHSVFSDVAVWLGEGVHADIVRGPLAVPHDPRYNFALNTRVFLRVWRRVLAQADFRRYNWTLKVDPDTVFLPGRVRERLRRAPPPSGRVALVNCHFGLHGPIEVLSRPAVEALHEGIPRCRREKAALVNTTGEDIFLQECPRLLGVQLTDDFRLLSEEACMERPFPCTSGKAAFHPMKSVDKYLECQAQAQETLSVRYSQDGTSFANVSAAWA